MSYMSTLCIRIKTYLGTLCITNEISLDSGHNPGATIPIFALFSFQEELNHHPSVLWLDSSARIAYPFFATAFDAAINADGFTSFWGTTYTVYSVTHPGMYHFLPTDTARLKRTVAREAGYVLVYRTKSVYRNVMYWWAMCALDRDCISPAWNNPVCVWPLIGVMEYLHCHKYDQSALNVLLVNHYGQKLEEYSTKFSLILSVRHGGKEGILRQCPLEWSDD